MDRLDIVVNGLDRTCLRLGSFSTLLRFGSSVIAHSHRLTTYVCTCMHSNATNMQSSRFSHPRPGSANSRSKRPDSNTTTTRPTSCISFCSSFVLLCASAGGKISLESENSVTYREKRKVKRAKLARGVCQLGRSTRLSSRTDYLRIKDENEQEKTSFCVNRLSNKTHTFSVRLILFGIEMEDRKNDEIGRKNATIGIRV